MRTAPRFAALAYRDFRLLWAGSMVSSVGTQMQVIAVNWQVYKLLAGKALHLGGPGGLKLEADALGLGTLGLARVLPIIAFALLGGMLADARDRRHVMLAAQAAQMAVAVVLAVMTLSGRINVGAIYLLTAAAAAAAAFDGPARQALVPNLVRREHLANAVSLNTMLWYAGTTIGPGLAGLLVARHGVGVVYAIDAVSFTAVIAALLAMRTRGRPAQAAEVGRRALTEGLRFTFRAPLIWSTMLLDFLATFFASARTMLPLVADRLLGVGVEGYGLLATAQPVGAVAAGTVLATRHEIRRQGPVLLVSVAVYGLATAIFGLSSWFWLSYVLFAVTGAGDTVSSVIRGTIRQVMTPDRLRGRMTSVNMVFFMGGPQLGELEAGVVAAALGVPFAIVSGGLATVVLTAWIARRYPALRRYTVPPVPAAAVAPVAEAS